MSPAARAGREKWKGRVMADLDHLNQEFEKLHGYVMIDRSRAEPSLSTRVTLTEVAVAGISSNLGKMVWLLVGIFATIVADIIVHASGVHI
jgi:hypothetical protein